VADIQKKVAEKKLKEQEKIRRLDAEQKQKNLKRMEEVSQNSQYARKRQLE